MTLALFFWTPCQSNDHWLVTLRSTQIIDIMPLCVNSADLAVPYISLSHSWMQWYRFVAGAYPKMMQIWRYFHGKGMKKIWKIALLSYFWVSDLSRSPFSVRNAWPTSFIVWKPWRCKVWRSWWGPHSRQRRSSSIFASGNGAYPPVSGNFNFSDCGKIMICGKLKGRSLDRYGLYQGLVHVRF